VLLARAAAVDPLDWLAAAEPELAQLRETADETNGQA
jgi:hypothetical protein